MSDSRIDLDYCSGLLLEIAADHGTDFEVLIDAAYIVADKHRGEPDTPATVLAHSLVAAYEAKQANASPKAKHHPANF